MHKWLIIVYSVPLLRQESSVSSQIQRIKANKQKLGLAWNICSAVFCGVLCLTTKAFFIRRVLFVTCFQYGHCEVLIYLTEPGPALWHAKLPCLFSYTHWLHISGRKLTAFQQPSHGLDNILWVEERTRCFQCFTVTLSRDKFKSEAAAGKTRCTDAHIHTHTGFSFKSQLWLTHPTRNVVCGCVLNMVKVSIK